MASRIGIAISRVGGRQNEQVARGIRFNVAIGAWAEGDTVPSMESLARELGVSESTVRAAYARLIAAGVLVAKDRSGTKVAIGARSSALLEAVARDELAEPIARLQGLCVPRDLIEDAAREIIHEQFHDNDEEDTV